MNWDQALVAMRDGRQVRQVSESMTRFSGKGKLHLGTEPAKLKTSYTEYGTQIRVLVGAWSEAPFVPTKVMLAATDWIALPKCEVRA